MRKGYGRPLCGTPASRCKRGSPSGASGQMPTPTPARPRLWRLDDPQDLEQDHDHDDQDDQATDAVSVVHVFLLTFRSYSALRRFDDSRTINLSRILAEEAYTWRCSMARRATTSSPRRQRGEVGGGPERVALNRTLLCHRTTPTHLPRETLREDHQSRLWSAAGRIRSSHTTPGVTGRPDSLRPYELSLPGDSQSALWGRGWRGKQVSPASMAERVVCEFTR
jgi:hypothetical protein